MLIVRQPNGVAAHIDEDVEVLLLVGTGDGPAFHRTILMHGGAVQQQMLAVQKEALVGIEGQGPQAQRLGDTVENLALGERTVTTV